MNIITQLLNALPGSISQGLIWGIMAIGVYLTYRILDIADLTVDGSFATGGVVAVVLILNGCNLWLAMLLAFVSGILVGVITGLLNILLGIPHILAGILTQLALYSINLKILGKANQSVNVNKTELLISLRWVRDFAFHNPLITVGIVLALLIGILYWFFGTEMGCAIRATGANLNMSRAQGINTNFNKVLGIMLSNGLVAFSGAFLAQFQGFADVKMGQGAIVIALAAVIIGEALFGKIFKNFALRLLSVAFGSIIYYIVIQTVVTLGFDANLLKLLSAAIVAIFLGIPHLKKQYDQNHIRKYKGGRSDA
ncbi:MAG: ABC transporter permease [Clostridia bacterium]|nr:ABC transporter permease [Clostridia bacterium]